MTLQGQKIALWGMVAMSSTSQQSKADPDEPYSKEEQKILLEIAEQSIEHGLNQGCSLPIQTAQYPETLQATRATFVTLKKQGELRGCIGTLNATRPLVNDIAYNAYAAAFEDPRFPPLLANEKDLLEISISILSTPEPAIFTSEQALIEQLRPGIDGLILEDSYHRGTFLPSVWESLPDPQQFISHLKLKAGLPADYWSDSIKVKKYTTFSFASHPNTH